MSALFVRTQLGALSLLNRIVMAPMTRSRASPDDDLPSALHTQYYTQRASAGLIVTEGVHPSIHGKGYCRTPGIYSEQQIAAWSVVTSSVHSAGGRIVLQLMHVGRIAAAQNKRAEAETVAPSAVRANAKMFTDSAGVVEVAMPRALETVEVPKVVGEYATAARNALRAGFDGVELHCASGYLPMQFLSPNVNLRSDRYGGTRTRRLTFAIEVAEAVSSAIGADRVGIRICPGVTFNDVFDDDPHATYSELLKAISSLQLAYLHVIRSPRTDIDAFAIARGTFAGPLIVNDAFDHASGASAIEGPVAAVSYARPFIGNPDLVERFRNGHETSPFDRRTLYTPGAKGYTDYPCFGGAKA